MPATVTSKLKYSAPSQTRSFLRLSGTFEYLLTGESVRPRLPEEYLDGPSAAAKNLVLILIDGWGWHSAFDPSLPFVARVTKGSGSIVREMDSGFPTTTAAMLPSLYLGEPPTAHGYVEWRHYEESVGAMINVLPWRFDDDHGQRETLTRVVKDPLTILRPGKFFKELKARGVASYLVQPEELKDSTFNRYTVPAEDATTVYFKTVRAGLDEVTRALVGPGEHKLIVLYAMKYDHISHLLGPASAGAREALVQILDEVDDWYLSASGRHPGTVVTMTADHGQIHYPMTQWIRLPEKAPLLEKYLRRDASGRLINTGGSARDRFCYLQPGSAEEAAEVVSRELEGLADVILVRDLIDRGFFGSGTPSERFLRRIGDLCILPHAGCITGWDGQLGKDLGHHGGLSEEESKVPWILTRLD